VSGIVSNLLGIFMYIHAQLLHSVIIDKDHITKRAIALSRHVHKIVDFKNENLCLITQRHIYTK